VKVIRLLELFILTFVFSFIVKQYCLFIAYYLCIENAEGYVLIAVYLFIYLFA